MLTNGEENTEDGLIPKNVLQKWKITIEKRTSQNTTVQIQLYFIMDSKNNSLDYIQGNTTNILSYTSKSICSSNSAL